MKQRKGFVSNSSSSSFMITNTSSEVKTLVDFVRENPQLVEEFKAQYDWYKDDDRFTQENMLLGAADVSYATEFQPGEGIECTFGDEDGTVIGHVFDYILRDGGSSASFSWYFYDSYR